MVEEASKKKRKRTREADDDDRLRKRKTTPQDQLVKFTVVEDDEESGPVIASTPGLDIPGSVSWKAYSKPRTTKSGKSSLKTELHLHSSSHPHLDYVAREDNSEGLLRHYVGIFDPENGELKVIPARKLVVSGALRAARPETNREEESEQPLKTLFAARTELGEAFGTKKSKKALRSVTENAIVSLSKAENAVGKKPLGAGATAVINSISQAPDSMPSQEDLRAVAEDAKPRPKANVLAETPAEVYGLENLIGSDTLKITDINDWQDAVKNDREVKTPSRFVSNRLVSVFNSGNRKNMKALSFLLTLMQWTKGMKIKGKSGRRLPSKEDIQEAMPGVSGFVLDSMRKKFAPDIDLNRWAVDNLMTHICAIALTIDNFSTDIHDLREDLRLENKGIVQYYRELGCKVRAPTETELARIGVAKNLASQHQIAQLKIPLSFPKPRIAATKRR